MAPRADEHHQAPPRQATKSSDRSISNERFEDVAVEVREYFRLFGREPLLDELLNETT
jgi:hypothetical protein